MENRKLKRNPNFHEERMIEKRERESKHSETWGSAVKYYDQNTKRNSKFEEWTSPRYYETNNELMAGIKKTRDKNESLEKRREKLQKLFMEEDQSYEIELIQKSADNYKNKSSRTDEIPTELLHSINNSLKLDEDIKRRHRAEQGLYKQWRSNHPVLRECETRQNMKDLKLSWLDQQIEKRMAKEKEEDQTRKLIKERELYIKEQQEKESLIKAEIQVKNDELKSYLEKQIEEYNEKERISEELKKEEAADLSRINEIEKLQHKHMAEERVRREKEIVIFNMNQHHRKLELKSREIENELEKDRIFMEEIKNAELIEKIQDETKKRELKESIDAFLQLLKELKDLELKRKPHIQFTFESEAKAIFNQFNGSWTKEQEMRTNLVKDVMEEIKTQIAENVKNHKQALIKSFEERTTILDSIEKYNKEMEELKQLEATKKEDFRKELDAQIKENKLHKKRLDGIEKNRADDELTKIRCEEERLKKEIMKMQKGKPCPTYGRKQFFY